MTTVLLFECDTKHPIQLEIASHGQVGHNEAFKSMKVLCYFYCILVSVGFFVLLVLV